MLAGAPWVDMMGMMSPTRSSASRRKGGLADMASAMSADGPVSVSLLEDASPAVPVNLKAATRDAHGCALSRLATALQADWDTQVVTDPTTGAPMLHVSVPRPSTSRATSALDSGVGWHDMNALAVVPRSARAHLQVASSASTTPSPFLADGDHGMYLADGCSDDEGYRFV